MRVVPILMGLFVIAIGVLFTLDNLGLIDAGQYLQFWPVVFVAVGVAKLSVARGGPGTMGGIVFVVIGVWLLLEQLSLIHVDLADAWPLLLVWLGGYLVWRGATAGGRARASLVAGRDADASFSAFAVMSGVVRRSTASPFLGADLTAVMGGCEIDLRGAHIGGEDAVIDVFAFWGGIDLRVPEDWAVVNRVTPFLGSLEDKTETVATAGAAPKRLVVRGLVVMGGVVVKN